MILAVTMAAFKDPGSLPAHGCRTDRAVHDRSRQAGSGRATHTPGQARELAGKLRTFARAARVRASGDRD
jgi:hypothetical protein